MFLPAGRDVEVTVTFVKQSIIWELRGQCKTDCPDAECGHRYSGQLI